ncbi:MAG: methylenetetrahydromethanopterin dehydrogenase [Candidatus Methanophagaceae archaeon]|nr:MAG: methylenetetrahydromethanopterin dehydrogenase [Methanophagales archaeon]
MLKVGFVKLGNIGTSRIVDLLLDERADREDIDVRVLGTGAKMTPEVAADTARLLDWDPDMVVVISPNAALPGPKRAREMVKERGKPCIVISDGPAKKAVNELKENGFGYLIIPGDPMIGARREFLDPVEMSIFNSDVLSVLSVTGAMRLVQEEIDSVIEALKAGKEAKLPQMIVTAEEAVERAKFSNPYAKAKAIAAYNMLERVAEMDARGCFMMKDPADYIPMVAAAHELLREASKLAFEAREMEKQADRLVREPHARSGELRSKEKLLEKPGA